MCKSGEWGEKPHAQIEMGKVLNQMALSKEMYERVTLILEQLAPERGKLKGRSIEFFDDQVKRRDRYGEDMFLSPKQISWLENLYEEHVGPLDHLEGVAQEPKESQSAAADVDVDDDIPF